MELFIVIRQGELNSKVNPKEMAMIKEGRDLLYENQVSYYNPKDEEIVFLVFRKSYMFISKEEEKIAN